MHHDNLATSCFIKPVGKTLSSKRLSQTDTAKSGMLGFKTPASPEMACPKVDKWCNTQMKVTKFSYLWTIDNFSLRTEKTGEVLNSSTFSTGNNEFCLRVFPKGNTEEYKNYVSLFLKLTRYPKSKQVLVKFKLSLLDAKGQKIHAWKSKQTDLFTESHARGFGGIYQT